MNPSLSSGLLRFLMGFYFPFLALLSLVMLTLITLLGRAVASVPLLWPFLLPLIGLLIWTLFQFLRASRALRLRPPSQEDSELRLPRQKLKGLYDLVEQVARERRLPAPQEIRLAADTVAHVYENEEGKEILVIGGFAVAAFSQKVLAGIIAHELTHFAAGDTRLLRRGFRRGAFMQLLEYHLAAQPGTLFNPLVWLVRAYHLLYSLVWAANSRQQEILADRQEVKQIGKKKAGAALLYFSVLEGLPWLRLSAIAESCAAANEPLDRIFAEQVRRAATVDRSDWQDACRRELRKQTGFLDTHPGLRDRLAAMGVSPRKALQLTLGQSGPPARDLLPEWEEVEKRLTQWLVDLYRARHAAKMEIAQIILGRPVYRQ